MSARILVVDDSPDVLLATVRTLRRDGHEIVNAGSVREAEQVWQRQRPDLVLLDVNLPDGNGIELSHLWKSMPDRATVPVVLRSAVSVSAAEQTLGLRSGADGYLVDPVEPEVLSATVTAHLRIRDLLADLARSTRNADDLVRYSIGLAHAARPDDVAGLLAKEAARSLGACETYLGWRRTGRFVQHRRASPSAPDGSVLRRLAETTGDRPRFLVDPTQLPAGLAPPPGQCAWAVLPFDDVEVSGVVAVAFPGPGCHDAAQRRFLATFANLTALSLGRAAALDLYESIAATLQRALVPRPTLVTGVRVQRRLIVGEGATIAGGDWFDGYPLPSGEQAIACGDVVGHGAEAAGASSIFRHTLRTLLLCGTEPGRAIVETNRLVLTHPAQPQGTMLAVRISTTDRSAHLYCAGHPPPVLIGPDGGATPVDLRPVLPLGMWDDLELPTPTVVHLPPGAMLLLVTDGVVERRDCDIDTGYERLTAAVRPARSPGEVIAAVDELLRTFPPTDDALYAVVDITG